MCLVVAHDTLADQVDALVLLCFRERDDMTKKGLLGIGSGIDGVGVLFPDELKFAGAALEEFRHEGDAAVCQNVLKD